MKSLFGSPLLLLITTGFISGQSTLTSRTFKGITEPFNSSTISAVVAGRVAIIFKKEGDYVKKGDVILELEREEEELEAQLRKLVADSKVEVNSARYKDSILYIDFLSTKQLFDSTKSVSEEELLKKELDYKMAVAEYERLLMQEKKEEIEYFIAQAEVRKRQIVAPFNGIVVKVHLKLAESCNPQEPIVRIADPSRCRFITHIESSYSTNLKVGMKVSLAIGGGTAIIAREGVVDFVSPVVDPSSGLREVKALFDNPENQIKPGVVGSMTIPEQ